MRIALNAELLSKALTFRSGGINRVIYELLVELARDPRGHTYDVYVPEAPAADDPASQGALRFHATGAITGRPSVRILWEQSFFPMRLASLRPSLTHHLAYAAPVAWPGPGVLTIYDLSFLRFPEAFKRGNRLYLTLLTRLSARRARAILTISEHSKRDIVRYLGIPPGRIVVTYPAADARYRPLPAAEVAAFRAARELPAAFLFTLGTLEPRKNLAGLLEAYARLPEPRAPLYVAGGAGWRYSPIFDRLQALRLERDVRFLGYVPENELPLWYNATRLFAYPSLYEGFGLPVVEAMACGTPVVTSTAASLPEVAGEAAALVPPDDPERLAHEMERLLSDAESETRRRMHEAGLIQAQRFTWRTLADQTVETYERAVAGDWR